MLKVLIALLLPLWLYANALSFEALRADERALVLSEFKKLYKERQNLHKNMRQLLKHVRAKQLNKKQLELFQPQSDASGNEALFAPINKDHQMEASNVFLGGVGCEGECATNETSVEEDQSVISTSESDNSEASYTPQKQNDIRQNVVSPWARK